MLPWLLALVPLPPWKIWHEWHRLQDVCSQTGWVAHTVLNDSYNANPASLLAGLQTLARQPGRRLAVVGTMAELGREARQWHRALGIAAARLGVALLAVGEFADDYLTGYHLQGGGEGDGCADLDQAVAIICERLAIGPTCLLVKGSRSAGLDVLLDDVRTALEEG